MHLLIRQYPTRIQGVVALPGLRTDYPKLSIARFSISIAAGVTATTFEGLRIETLFM